MSNTLIQIKRSTVTDVPSSLNIAEPAYSYSSNTFWMGTADGNGVIPVGGQTYVAKTNSAYDIARAAFDVANTGDPVGTSAFAKANDAYDLAGTAFDKANSANSLAYNTGIGANAFASATIAGANTAVGAGANAYADSVGAGANSYLLATVAGANTAVGAGANAYADSATAGANNYLLATIAGANTAVGAGANAFAAATIAGANAAVGAGANTVGSAAFDKANSANYLGYLVNANAVAAYGQANLVNAAVAAAFARANVSGISYTSGGSPTYRYWRVTFRNDNNWIALSDFYLESTQGAGWANGGSYTFSQSVTGGESQSSSYNTWADNNSGTSYGSGFGNAGRVVFLVDFGTAVSIANIRLVGKSDWGTGDQASYVGVEYSSDNSNWTSLRDVETSADLGWTTPSQTINVALGGGAGTTTYYNFTTDPASKQNYVLTLNASGDGVALVAQNSLGGGAAGAAYDKANAAALAASAGYVMANAANISAGAAFDAENVTRQIAIAAYANSNTKLSTSGGSIQGDLSIAGNLIITGNTVFTNVSTLTISDPLLYLAGNNYTSDLVDIGIVANYVNATGSNVHTGVFRDSTSKEWYVFQGYDKEPENNVIDPTDASFKLAVLNADIRTSNLVLGGANTIDWITAAFEKANSSASGEVGIAAFDKANAANVLAFNTGIGANAYADSVGAGANAYLLTTIAGANTAVGTGANAFASATIAGANTAVGAGANAYSDSVGAGANSYLLATIAGANTAVGAGANAYADSATAGANSYLLATIAGANTAVGAGANAFATSIGTAGNSYFQATIAGANTAVGAGANAYADSATAGANNYLLAVIAGANTAVGTGANTYLLEVIAGANTAVGTGANNYLLSVIAGANTAVGAGANTVGIAAFQAANAASAQAANADFINTGTLAVSYGGTGVNTFANNGVVFGNGTSPLRVTAAGIEGNVLQVSSQGTPQFGMLDGGSF